jgi:uracil-DNA glycosylase
MHHITLDHETDFDGWRQAARSLVLNDVIPADVTWRVQGDAPELFEPTDPPPEPSREATFNVPAKFVELAKAAILHYRLLWRLRTNHDLMTVATDPDVSQVSAMAKAVRHDEHKMHAFVRFREIGREHKSHYVAWFEPEHHIVELAAPFFARRFADMPWSILTPDLCAHWDGHAVSITQGVSKSEAPTEDRLEETWRRYYASIFNPARLKVKAMQNEMPKKYWRNLPEASLIKPLIESAERTASAMIAQGATEPHKSQKREEPPMVRKSAADDIAAPIAAPARSGRTPPRPCSAKDRKTLRSCWSANSPATRKTLRASRSSARPGKCWIVRWMRQVSTAQKSTSPMP